MSTKPVGIDEVRTLSCRAQRSGGYGDMTLRGRDPTHRVVTAGDMVIRRDRRHKISMSVVLPAAMHI